MTCSDLWFFLASQELKDLTQRNECLDLKGKRHGHYQCDLWNSTETMIYLFFFHVRFSSLTMHLFQNVWVIRLLRMSLGEKLDYKACESLEEILKRVQFKVIDLEQTNLDEDVWKSLLLISPPHWSSTQLSHLLLFKLFPFSFILSAPLWSFYSLSLLWWDVQCLS